VAERKKSGKGRKRPGQRGRPSKPDESSPFRGLGKVPKERWEAYFPNRSEASRPLDQEITHSLNHPLRVDIMTILSHKIASPNELMKELAVPLSTASYHVEQLLETDQIYLTHTEQRRGAVEHFYRAKAKPEVGDEEWKKLPRSVRRKIASIGLNFLVAESLASLGYGKMEADDDFAIICFQMHLNEDGRAKARVILAEAQERIEELRKEEDPDAPPRFLGLMQFERCRPDEPLDP
jgi:DNA-binding transcriptional ArsR family regulator